MRNRRTSLLICAYRSVSIPTLHSILELVDPDTDALEGENRWHVLTQTGDALISRARSVIASHWWRETREDVFLMVDDDVTFSRAAADAIVRRCREGREVVAAAYPVRGADRVAIATADGRTLMFGPGHPPIEVDYVSTGFVAVHRSVLDALIPTLPLCHASHPWAFWPLFQPLIASNPASTYLSEDWAFCRRARDAGVKVWLDPAIRVGHLAQVELTTANMHHVRAALEVR